MYIHAHVNAGVAGNAWDQDCIYIHVYIHVNSPASAEQAHPCHSAHRVQVSLGSQSSGEGPEISSARVVHTSCTGPRRTHTLQCGPEIV